MIRVNDHVVDSWLLFLLFLSCLILTAVHLQWRIDWRWQRGLLCFLRASPWLGPAAGDAAAAFDPPVEAGAAAAEEEPSASLCTCLILLLQRRPCRRLLLPLRTSARRSVSVQVLSELLSLASRNDTFPYVGGLCRGAKGPQEVVLNRASVIAAEILITQLGQVTAWSTVP